MSQRLPIRRLTISGFRGILSPLEICFLKGQTNAPSSMFVYGRNGTGKSSITDAWEWLQNNGRIEHLRKEGAQESSYPHIDAKADETYVDVEFSDPVLGSIHMEFDCDRVTRPICKGDVNLLRTLALHPCQLRFEDLTRFIYRTKSEKYDALAQLMGFTPQVELQKALRRVERQFVDAAEQERKQLDTQHSALAKLLSLELVDHDSVLAVLNRLPARHGIATASRVDALAPAVANLRQQVEKDPRAEELSSLGSAEKGLRAFAFPNDLPAALKAYVDGCRGLRADESRLFELLRLKLYEEGRNVLKQVQDGGGDTSICPLCGNHFEGDLLAHVNAELTALTQLRNMRDGLEVSREQLSKQMAAFRTSLESLLRVYRDQSEPFARLGLAEPQALAQIQQMGSHLASGLGHRAEEVETQDLEAADTHATALGNQGGVLVSVVADAIKVVAKRKAELEVDSSRAQLVGDYDLLKRAVEEWGRYRRQELVVRKYSIVKQHFEHIVQDYVQSSIADVQSRFALISGKLARYFGILEQGSPCLSGPVLRLLPDQDRAVELEVGFYGDPVCPAYKYLSESQLNSFGLAIFFASVRQFNSGFPFLLLDDIINSLDAHKRPRVVDLIRDEFADYQTLLLTHDDGWYEDLCDKLPSWAKMRFTRLERGSGPIADVSAAGSLDRVKELVDADRASEAGRNLGPYLERHLQELCESFEVLVKYNRRNEYTLDPLLDRFRIRAKDKLGAGHSLYLALNSLQESTSFRNLCAHWKNPAVQISADEMRDVVARWEAVRGLVFCPNCGRYAACDGNNSFICACRGTPLTLSKRD